MFVGFEFTGWIRLSKRLDKVPRVVRVLTSKLNSLMMQLQSKIVRENLSGQMLRRRTGNLARSVRVERAHVEGRTIEAGIEAGGSTAFYGKFYEYKRAGGTGGVPHSWVIMATKARALRFILDGKKVFAQSVRHPRLDARPFMSSAMLDMKPFIKEQLQQALDAELDES